MSKARPGALVAGEADSRPSGRNMDDPSAWKEWYADEYASFMQKMRDEDRYNADDFNAAKCWREGRANEVFPIKDKHKF